MCVCVCVSVNFLSAEEGGSEGGQTTQAKIETRRLADWIQSEWSWSEEKVEQTGGEVARTTALGKVENFRRRRFVSLFHSLLLLSYAACGVNLSSPVKVSFRFWCQEGDVWSADWLFSALTDLTDWCGKDFRITWTWFLLSYLSCRMFFRSGLVENILTPTQ